MVAGDAGAHEQNNVRNAFYEWYVGRGNKYAMRKITASGKSITRTRKSDT